MPVSYASVGASRAPDLLRFPPAGSTPYEEVLRLGSGEKRFVLASSVLMTWGAQRGAGLLVEDIRRGTGGDYEGVTFAADGSAQVAPEREDTFGPDGEPYLNAGTTASVTIRGGVARRVLVVYTIEEEFRVGFAWGTGDELGAIGEQQFSIERRDDDTVWAVARGFLVAPKSGLLGLKARADMRDAIEAVKRQLQALSPAAIATATEISEPEEALDVEAPEPEEAPDSAEIANDVDFDASEPQFSQSRPSDGGEDDAEVEAEVEAATEAEAEAEAEDADTVTDPSPAPRTHHQRRPSRPSADPGA